MIKVDFTQRDAQDFLDMLDRYISNPDMHSEATRALCDILVESLSGSNGVPVPDTHITNDKLKSDPDSKIRSLGGYQRYSERITLNGKYINPASSEGLFGLVSVICHEFTHHVQNVEGLSYDGGGHVYAELINDNGGRVYQYILEQIALAYGEDLEYVEHDLYRAQAHEMDARINANNMTNIILNTLIGRLMYNRMLNQSKENDAQMMKLIQYATKYLNSVDVEEKDFKDDLADGTSKVNVIKREWADESLVMQNARLCLAYEKESDELIKVKNAVMHAYIWSGKKSQYLIDALDAKCYAVLNTILTSEYAYSEQFDSHLADRLLGAVLSGDMPEDVTGASAIFLIKRMGIQSVDDMLCSLYNHKYFNAVANVLMCIDIRSTDVSRFAKLHAKVLSEYVRMPMLSSGLHISENTYCDYVVKISDMMTDVIRDEEYMDDYAKVKYARVLGTGDTTMLLWMSGYKNAYEAHRKYLANMPSAYTDNSYKAVINTATEQSL